MVDFIACAMIKVKKSILLVKRKDNNLWSFPGGHTEGKENPFETAIRETYEETGINLNKPIEDSFCNLWFEDKFISFIPFRLQELKEVVLDTTELIDAKLFLIDNLPDDCMDTVYTAIKWCEYDEHDVAQAIAKGELASPQYFDGNYLFDMRLTGTGAAKRNLEDNQKEITYRDPKKFLSKKFLNLCNGVRVVFDHPEKDNVDTEYLRNRQVGTVILPYVFDQEVWAIVKISSPLFSQMLMKTVYSTSPSVSNRSKNRPVYFEKDRRALYETSPYVIDHLAIVTNGVWDKDGEVLPGISTPINYINKNGARIIMGYDLDSRYDELMAKAEEKKNEDRRDRRDRRSDARKKDDNNAFLEESKRKYEDELDYFQERISKGDVTDEDKQYLERAREQYENAKKSVNNDARRDQRNDRCDRNDRKDNKEQDLSDKARKDSADQPISRDEMKGMFKELAAQIGDCVSGALLKKDAAEPITEPPAEGDKKKNDSEPEGNGGVEPPKEEKPDVDNKAVEALLASKEKTTELSDEDRTQISDCQQNYDVAYKLHGKRVPTPLAYETPEQYGGRVLRGVIQHSPKWNKYGANKIANDKDLLKMALGEVAQDAIKAAQTTLSDKGELRMTETHDGARTIRSYSGSSRAFLSQFSPPDRVGTLH